MSYTSQAQLSNDSDFLARTSAAAATEVPKTHQPTQWAADHIWWMAASPGFADAYESALAGDVERPGNDPAVISDAQILSAIQTLLNEQPPQEEAS
jgi:hypothetical protein